MVSHIYAKDKWNTYGEPPNSDLLRRYGHVDQVPLPEGGFGNPADIVEICADLAVECTVQKYPDLAGWSSERVDWWLEEGGEEWVASSTRHSGFSDLTL